MFQLNAAQRLGLEVDARRSQEWFDNLSPQRQKEYLEKYPRSKFGPNPRGRARPKPKTEEAPKVEDSEPVDKPVTEEPIKEPVKEKKEQRKQKTETPKPETKAPQQQTQQQAPATGKAAHKAATLQMKPQEITAFKGYTGAMFRTVNPALRAGKKVPREDRKDVELMDKAFERASTTEPLEVYRGLSGEFADKLQPGMSYTDGGFSSTTTSKDTAESFTWGEGKALMQIRVPKGSKAISMNDVSQFSHKEQEILLNRNGKYTVVEVKPATRTRPKLVIVEYQDG